MPREPGRAGSHRAAAAVPAALGATLVALSCSALLATRGGALVDWREPALLVVGVLCLAAGYAIRAGPRYDPRERDAWRGMSGAAAMIGVALVVESAVGAAVRGGHLPGDLLGSGFAVGVAAASALLYQGLIHWNRFKSYHSDPDDWLNGVGAVATIVAGGVLLIQITDAPMRSWDLVQVHVWLAHASVLLVLLGTTSTIAKLGGLAHDLRIRLVAGVLAGSAVLEVAVAFRGDVELTRATTDVVWVLVVAVLTLCSRLRPARLTPHVTTTQAPTVGALVVLLASIAVLALNGVAGGSRPLSTTLLAAAAGLGAAVRLLHLVRSLAELTQSQHEARTDDLTGVANRRGLSLGVAAAARRGEPAALLVLDLDHFKEVNDRHGHATGDAVLKVIALRLQAHLWGTSLLGRLGGDEFAVLLTGPVAARSPEIGHLLLRACTEPIEVLDLQVQLGASIGIASTDLGDHAVDDLMRRADAAMYFAKRTGGGVSLYDEKADERAQQENDRLEELRVVLGPDASALERAQIVVHFQPQVDIGSGLAVGAEALVRWQHPELGLLYPDAFLHLVEQHGLMVELTALVLKQAVAEAVDWHTSGHRVRVAVNLSTSSLVDPALLQVVDSVVAASGIDPSLLVLEITETTLMIDPELSLEVVRAIAGRGIGISIDDFGTGYSSLAYLNDLPAGELKLDRAFTSRLVAEPRTAAIVAGTVVLAHRLGLRLIAEGVEDEATLSALARLGCDETQGYLHARPMPAERFRVWLGRAAPVATG